MSAVPQVVPEVKWPLNFNEVPKEVFTREDVYQAELKRIFYGPEWHPVAHESEVPHPGDFKTTKLAEVPLLIVRGTDNVVRVFYNACSHRSNQLETKPFGNRAEFECPYHRWLFGSDGKLIGCPNQREFTPGFRKEDFPLAQPRFESLAGLIFVTLAPDTIALREFLAEMADDLTAIMGGDGRLKLLGYQKVQYESNWKSYGDNDGYHPPLLHQAFTMLGWQGGKGKQIVTRSRGHLCIETQLTVPRGADQLRDKSVVEMREDPGVQSSRVLGLFPLLVASNYLNVISLRFATPVSPTKTEVHYTYFARADDDEAMVRHRIRQSSNAIGPSGLISMEDASIFHRIQIGNHAPGKATFQKGVKNPSELSYEVGQNDESGNLPRWEYYRSAMGFERVAQ